MYYNFTTDSYNYYYKIFYLYIYFHVLKNIQAFHGRIKYLEKSIIKLLVQ